MIFTSGLVLKNLSSHGRKFFALLISILYEKENRASVEGWLLDLRLNQDARLSLGAVESCVFRVSRDASNRVWVAPHSQTY